MANILELTDVVKTYQTAEPDVIATVNGEMTADAIATVLSMHLSGEQQPTASGSE